MKDKQLIIKARIMFEWDFCAMCVVKLYRYQTEDEKDSRSSQHNNGVGFNKIDAAYLTPVAEDIITGKTTNRLIRKIATKIMEKYCKQLSTILTDEEVEG